MTKQKITTFLWFRDEAEEAATLYTSILPDARIVDVQRWGEGGPGKPGSALSVSFDLAGQRFTALNGRPGDFGFNASISLFVSCATQKELDGYWDQLVANGGKAVQCGWLQDCFGVSWQLIPDNLGALLGDPDPAKSQRAMQAMLKMQKLDIATLERAHRGD